MRIRLNRPTLAAAIAAVLMTTGCVTTPSYPTPRPLGQELQTFSAPARIDDRTTPQAPPAIETVDQLTLRAALSRALLRNPGLASTSWDVRAAEARTLQAGAWPNPEIRIELDDFGGSGRFRDTDKAEQSIRLSQAIDLSGKTSHRRRTAELEAKLVGWDYEAARLAVFAETSKAFTAVLAAQERLAAAEALHEQAQAVMASVDKHVQAGTGSRIQAQQAKMALGASQIELENARCALEARRGILASFWDAEEAAFGEAVGTWDTLADNEPPALADLLKFTADNPDVARWSAEARMRRAAVDLAKADAVSDVRVLFTAKRLEETHEHGYTLALELPLPLFDRNTGAVREARAKRAKAASDRRAAVMTVNAELRDAHETLASAFQEAKLRRTVSLPMATEAAKTVGLIVASGAARDLQLIKAQQTLYKETINYIDAVEAYHTATAEIERLTGHPLQD